MAASNRRRRKECKYLGVTIDSQLTLSSHIRNIFCCAYYHLHRIGKIRRFLDAPTALRLVHAFVLSRVDYCNAVFVGLPLNLLDCIQRVINSAARLVRRVRRREHITPHLRDLKWLPASRRSEFKLALHAFRCLCRCEDRPLPPRCFNCSAPLYLSSRLRIYLPKRSLRSSAERALMVPTFRTITHGDRAFSRSCALVWNSLPTTVTSSSSFSVFRARLMSHLLSLSYPNDPL